MMLGDELKTTIRDRLTELIRKRFWRRIVERFYTRRTTNVKNKYVLIAFALLTDNRTDEKHTLRSSNELQVN